MADFDAFPTLTPEQRARLARLGIDAEQSFAEWMLSLSPSWARKQRLRPSPDLWLALVAELSRRPSPPRIPLAVVIPSRA